MGSFRGAVITQGDGIKIRSYINLTRNPVATILPTISVANFRPAPVVAFFSSRGPASNTPNLLKPDIAAPGNAILAAWPANDTEVTLPGQEPPLFNIVSGTSMSCAHVSGIAATLKSQNPTWSPSAIRSAIMTTGKQFEQSNDSQQCIQKIPCHATRLWCRSRNRIRSIKSRFGLRDRDHILPAVPLLYRL
ncbi:hypothetical protein K7X08_015804 [Anisodus acutangulus]|uniref:Peptidase S8/S53 domain-containing protein n=1 Tax=Anisodus acutangulus TaxID=402998 RepID=A0A9Q1LEU9_9SOLA|nr:hypothetical protein K7X08_015804 [Anisodus acutangulus]